MTDQTDYHLKDRKRIYPSDLEDIYCALKETADLAILASEPNGKMMEARALRAIAYAIEGQAAKLQRLHDIFLKGDAS